MSIIKVEGISKKYQLGHIVSSRNLANPFKRGLQRLMGHPVHEEVVEDFWALKDINFEVAEGEVLGIIGKNGAGKSTLLKILSRITDPTEGRIELNGRVSSLLEVGTGFNPELTGRENIFLNGSILGMSRREIQGKFDEIVAFAEVERFLDTPVKRYSSGMYVRLAFAIAAHLEPEILVVDEVLAVGDSEFQKKCLGKMHEVGKHGRTVLFVSHNMTAVEALCTNCLSLSDGCIVEIGSSHDVITNYLQDFASSNNMTFWERNKLGSKTTSSPVVEINKIELLSLDGKGPVTISTGQGLLVRIHYSAYLSPRSITFNFILKTNLGVEVLRLNTLPISGFHIEKLFDQGVVELAIDSLPLTAGIYSVTIGIAKEKVEWIQVVEDALSIEIYPTDYYGSGMSLDSSKGIIVADHKWHHFKA